MNSQYIEGRKARNKGKPKAACPHGWAAFVEGSPTYVREKDKPSELCMRHWWLAGWHDRDIELGGMEGAA